MPDMIKEALNSLAQGLPFVMMVDGRPTLNTARIKEGVMIAVISGVVAGIAASYINTIRMEEKMNFVILQMQELGSELKEIKRDFYAPKVYNETGKKDQRRPGP
jgi:hypothetical protein